MSSSSLAWVCLMAFRQGAVRAPVLSDVITHRSGIFFGVPKITTYLIWVTYAILWILGKVDCRFALQSPSEGWKAP
jgi:hypothetical protein